MASSKRRAGSNAFDVLMQAESRKRRSRFVACPAGCGASVLAFKVNEHLDACCGPTTQNGTNKTRDYQSNEEVYGKTTSVTIPGCKNAFEFMMTQSTPLRHRFHLADGCRLSWIENEDPPGFVAWSTTIVMQPKKSRKILLAISTSFSPRGEKTGDLVRRHSRLSVGVLKSMLQKLVRRRRPLPATKVAMELHDKSPDALLRRLPVIVLEDSTLHPDFPLLVWLMAANSKGFVAPPVLVEKVLRIVFQVASCPWSDECGRSNNGVVHGVESIQDVLDNHSFSMEKKTMLLSMMVRASYGGMACDVRMIHGYVSCWMDRWLHRVPKHVSERLQAYYKKSQDDGWWWWQILFSLHENARERSQSSTLFLEGIDRLCRSDVCVQGVDFHCSSVLDELLGDANLVAECNQHLGSKEDLLKTLKKCMWLFSSGVNLRRPIWGTAVKSKEYIEKEKKLESLWRGVVKDRANQYMTRFVEARLV